MAQRVMFHWQTPILATTMNKEKEHDTSAGVISGFSVVPGPGRTLRVCHAIGESKSMLIMPNTLVKVVEEGIEPYFAALQMPASTDARLVVCTFTLVEGGSSQATYSLVADGTIGANQILLARVKPLALTGDIQPQDIVLSRRGLRTDNDLVRRDTLRMFGIERGVGYCGTGDSFDIKQYTTDGNTLYASFGDGNVAIKSDVISGFGPSKVALATYPVQTAHNVVVLAEYVPDNPLSCPTLRAVPEALYDPTGPMSPYQVALHRFSITHGNTPPDGTAYSLYLTYYDRYKDLRDLSRVLCLDQVRAGYIGAKQAAVIAAMTSSL